MKKLLLVFLIMFSTSAMSEWVQMTKTDEIELAYDANSLSKEGSKGAITVMMLPSEPVVNDRNRKIVAITSRVEADCSRYTYLVTEESHYTDRELTQRVDYVTNKEAEFDPIREAEEGTFAREWVDLICG